MIGSHVQHPECLCIQDCEENEYDNLQRLGSYETALVDIAALDRAIAQSVVDRIEFAGRLLAFAKSTVPMGGDALSDMAARTVVSRSYYSVHHLARAVTLYKRRFDPFDHLVSIEQLVAIFNQEEDYKSSIATYRTDVKGLRKALMRLLATRQRADYDIYGAAFPTALPVDFVAATVAALGLASELYNGTVGWLRVEGINIR